MRRGVSGKRKKRFSIGPVGLDVADELFGVEISRISAGGILGQIWPVTEMRSARFEPNRIKVRARALEKVE